LTGALFAVKMRKSIGLMRGKKVFDFFLIAEIPDKKFVFCPHSRHRTGFCEHTGGNPDELSVVVVCRPDFTGFKHARNPRSRAPLCSARRLNSARQTI
jgi:hypothetical protein